jgi:hypothetical protein
VRGDAWWDQRDTFRRDTGARQEIPRCRGRGDDGVDPFQQVDIMLALGGSPCRAEAVLRLHDDWAPGRRSVRDAQGDCGRNRRVRMKNVDRAGISKLPQSRDDLFIARRCAFEQRVFGAYWNSGALEPIDVLSVILESSRPRCRCDDEDVIAGRALSACEICDRATLSAEQKGREMDDRTGHQEVRLEPQTIGMCC